MPGKLLIAVCSIETLEAAPMKDARGAKKSLVEFFLCQ